MLGSTKAASIYKLLGENLPMEVFEKLSAEEMEKLLQKITNPVPLPQKEEDRLLREFISSVGKKTPNTKKNAPRALEFAPNDFKSDRISEDEERIISEIHSILKEESPSESPMEFLTRLDAQSVGALLVDEPPRIIAQILFFASDRVSEDLIQRLPSSIQEEVILEMGDLDFHSYHLRDELERFLRFKWNLLQSTDNPNLQKIKGRQSKKAANLLNQLNPGESREILSKIQKKRPQFAENIIEHYYSFRDLLLLGRKSLSEFLGSFHPLVIATALKGVERDLEKDILSGIEPWVAKEVRLESASLGPVSLAEIEETHKGILDKLREEIEGGRLKLWRFR